VPQQPGDQLALQFIYFKAQSLQFRRSGGNGAVRKTGELLQHPERLLHPAGISRYQRRQVLMARRRHRSPGGTNILCHPASRQKLLLQGADVFHQPVTQGLESSAEGSITQKETRYILKYPQSLPKAIEVSIDKAQH
jgi:hypothetical protein